MTRLDGPDVSHFQYTPTRGPDWAVCRSAGCWFGATKLTQSITYADPTGPASREGMRAAGFTHVGLYHWLSATTAIPLQVAWFLKNLRALRKGEFVMLDAEEAGVTAAMVIAWCSMVEALTARPVVVYTGAFTAGGTIWQSTSVRNSARGPRPRILAAYTTEAKAKALPGVKSYPWQGWQFSSNGPVPGIEGRCDMNRIDDKPGFDLAAGLAGDDNSDPDDVDPPVSTAGSITEQELMVMPGSWTVVGVKEQGDGKRFLWNGFVKIDVTADDAADFILGGLTVDGVGHDLDNPYWMPAAQLNKYRTVATGSIG